MAWRRVYSANIMRLLIGIFFILMGIAGISNTLDESVFSLPNNQRTMEVVFGVIEIVCGIILFAGLFSFVAKKYAFMGSIVVLVLWIVRIVLTRFIWGFPSGRSSVDHFMGWALILGAELIIGAGIMAVVRSEE